MNEDALTALADLIEFRRTNGHDTVLVDIDILEALTGLAASVCRCGRRAVDEGSTV